MKGKGRFIRNMERDWKMKNEAKKYRGKYDQSILYTYVKFSKKSQAIVKNILMKISLKMYGALP